MNKLDNMRKKTNSFKNNLHTNSKLNKIDYFITGPDMEVNTVASAETTQKIHYEYSDVLTGIGCFRGAFFTGQRWHKSVQGIT